MAGNFIMFIKNFAVFGVGGMVIFIFELFLTILLTEHFEVKYYNSFAIALFIGTVLLYFYHSSITFPNSRKKRYHYFFFTYTFSGALFWFLSILVTKMVKLHYSLGIILTAVPISIINFSINKYIVFKS